MASRCRFSGLAEADLDSVALHIASRNPRAALRFVGNLRRRCEELTNPPAKHRLREEFGAGVRVAAHGKYLIFYAEQRDEVVIERILHGARRLDWVYFKPSPPA